MTMFKSFAFAVMTSGLLLTLSPAPAQAQNCQDMYARMMRSYERGSPRYEQRRAEYAQACQGREGRGRGGGRGQCDELRAACLNKDRLGEQGEGNCRRYREMCRGR